LLPRDDAVLPPSEVPGSIASRIRFLPHSGVSRIGSANLSPRSAREVRVFRSLSEPVAAHL
jgi:hypothetical protein